MRRRPAYVAGGLRLGQSAQLAARPHDGPRRAGHRAQPRPAAQRGGRHRHDVQTATRLLLAPPREPLPGGHQRDREANAADVAGVGDEPAQGPLDGHQARAADRVPRRVVPRSHPSCNDVILLYYYYS